MPKQPLDCSFQQTAETLTQIFGEQSSLFNLRYQCLNLSKCDTDDFVTHTVIVNRMCEQFKLSSLSEDQVRCLIFICSLQSSRDSDLRLRLFNKIKQNSAATLQNLQTECQHLLNLKHDTAMVPRFTRSTSLPQPNSRLQLFKRKPLRLHAASAELGIFIGTAHIGSIIANAASELDTRKVTAMQPGLSSGTDIGTTNHKVKSLGVMLTFHSHATASRQYVTLYCSMASHFSVRQQLDTAADVTIISQKLWRRIGSPPITESSQTASSACGGAVQSIGQLRCSVVSCNVTSETTCFISSHI